MPDAAAAAGFMMKNISSKAAIPLSAGTKVIASHGSPSMTALIGKHRYYFVFAQDLCIES